MKNRPKNKDIFVADISFEAGEDDLRKLFSVCGTVRSVHLLTDKRSGLFSGRAFVRMETAAEAKEAVQMLDGALLIDRCVRVSAARDKPTGESPAEPEAVRRRRSGNRSGRSRR